MTKRSLLFGLVFVATCGSEPEPLSSPDGGVDAGAPIDATAGPSDCALLCHSFANCWNLQAAAEVDRFVPDGTGRCAVNRELEDFTECVVDCEALSDQTSSANNEACLQKAIASGNQICIELERRDFFDGCPEFDDFADSAWFRTRQALECWVGTDANPGATCEFEDARVHVDFYKVSEQIHSLSFTGTVSVVGVDPMLLLHPVEGATVAVVLDDVSAPELTLGAMLDVSLVRGGFNPTHAIALREPTGELIYAAWDGQWPPLDDGLVTYEYANCSSIDLCGEHIARNLHVETSKGSVVVGAGERVRLADFIVTNGYSLALVVIPRCSDYRPRIEGSIKRR